MPLLVPGVEAAAPRPPHRRRRRARGQSMVLACLAFLVLALMVMLSFNLSHALRQKINLQQHSDTMAYSMAVLEARALNYYAVSNRAIAASFVAMTSMHAYMSTASLTYGMLKASQNNFYVIMGMEFLECFACWPPCIQHCKDAIEAIKVANKYSKKAKTYADNIKDLDGPFEDTTKHLQKLIQAVNGSQIATHAKVVAAVTSGTSSGLKELTEWNAKGASNIAGAVGGMNANEFNCVVDGMPCMGGEPNAKQVAVQKTMTEIANASRPGWPATRDAGALIFPLTLHPTFLQELISDIPGEGIHAPIPFIMKSAASIGKGKKDWNPVGGVGIQGTTVVSREDGGAMMNQWRHGIGPYMPFDAEVYSDESGGGHSPKQGHKDKHEFKQVASKALLSCIPQSNCFMKFRGNPKADADYGQARVYSYVTKSLRSGNLQQAPWELTSSATLNFTHGEQGTGTLTLAADEGAAVSKALVYYHRLGQGGWQEQPNLFNPFWRAKLHPFKAEEVAKVLGAAGNADAAQIAVAKDLAL
ncbi:hypothetical protein D7X55_12410 [Corallococcus sp. AB049A]|nr:hypothetical protein D7X55_12410 [Corallococcus sp. AB049A]